MATSDVGVCNLAMQILGAERITSLTQNTKEARECNACYEALRDAEIRAHPWNFAKKRTTLAPHGTEPDHDYLYAFRLPTDCIRVLPPSRDGLDWVMEDHEGLPAILTNDGDTLEVSYLERVTDPNRYDQCFVMALAARIAEHLCEAITSSNEKEAKAQRKYKEAIALAKRTNAFEQVSAEPPQDPWITARL